MIKKLVKQVRVIKSTGEIELFYGTTAKNDVLNNFENINATVFNDPIALAVHPNRSVYVLDQGDNVLYHIKSSITKSESNGKYTIVSPDTREAYVFNRFGLHLNTIDLITGNHIYNFSYSGNALSGKLVSISDQSKKQLVIKRDFHGRAESIQTPNNYLIKLKLNNFDMLRSITNPDNKTINFNYLSNTGLLTSKVEANSKTTAFSYEKNGKVKEIIESNNMKTSINYFINSSGIVTEMTRADGYKETWVNNETYTFIFKNEKLDTTIEADKFDVNLRSVENDDIFNEFKVYYKSATLDGDLKDKRIKSFIKLKRNLDFTKGRHRKRNKRSAPKAAANFSLDVESLSGNENTENSVYYLKTNDLVDLKIEYNKLEKVETFENSESKELFRVEYNDLGLPNNFKSKYLASTALNYDNNGKLLSWKRGNKLKEEYVYDLKGRLIEIKYNNGDSTKYSYGDGLLPIAITLPNRDHYVLHRDNVGNIQQIITPKQLKHRLAVVQSLNSVRMLYYPPEFKSPFVWVYNQQGELVQQIYPSNYRYVTYIREANNELKKVVWDQSSIEISKQANENRLTIKTLVTTNKYRISNERIYSVNLLTEVKNKIEAGRLVNSEFNYNYDTNRRLTGIQATIGDNLKSSMVINYKSKNGNKRFYEKLNNFQFQRDSSSNNELTVNDESFNLNLRRDDTSQLSEISLKIRNVLRFKGNYEYDERSRLVSFSYKINDNVLDELNPALMSEKTYSYQYDANDRLVQVSLSKQRKLKLQKTYFENEDKVWQIYYDSNGNSILEESKNGNKNRQQFNINLQINGADQLMTFDRENNKIRYKYDVDGFMYRRSDSLNEDTVFVFDSNQLLTKAKLNANNNKTIEYVYDDRKRLIARRHYTGYSIQYFYADESRPSLVTHVYDQNTMQLSAYYYTEDSRLFAVERNSQLFYVITDLLNTPLFVYDANGKLLNQYSYDPFGYEADETSGSKFQLYLSYKGAVYDQEAKIAFIEGNSYDPLSGRYLAPNLDLVKNILLNPTNVNLYQAFQTKPFNSDDDYFFKESKSWLHYFGYNINEQAKMLDGPSQAHHKASGSALNSAIFWCKTCFLNSLDKKFNFFQSKLLKLSKLNTIYYPTHDKGYDVTLVNSVSTTNNDNIQFFDNANSELGLKLVVSSLLPTSNNNNNEGVFNNLDFLFNQSVSLNNLPNCVYNGQEIIELVKPDKTRKDFEEDLVRAGIKKDTIYTENGVKITVDREIDSPYSEIRIQSNYSLISIKYGTSINKEHEKYIESIRHKSEDLLWLKERQNVLGLNEYSYSWQKSDIDAISSIGSVKDVSFKITRDVISEPLMLCDPNNLKFVKKAGG